MLIKGGSEKRIMKRVSIEPKIKKTMKDSKVLIKDSTKRRKTIKDSDVIELFHLEFFKYCRMLNFHKNFITRVSRGPFDSPK